MQRMIEIEDGTIELIHKDIILFEAAVTGGQSESVAKFIRDAIKQLKDTEKVGIIFDIRKLKKTVPKNVRDTITEEIKAVLYGTVILTESSLTKIIGNIALSFAKKTDYPRKIFNSKEDAIVWLKQIVH